jgi:hypothetical protein
MAMNFPSQDLSVERDLKATFEKAALDDRDTRARSYGQRDCGRY